MTFWEFADKHIERIEFKHVIALIVVAFSLWLFKLVLFQQLPDSGDKHGAQIITGLFGCLNMVLGLWFIATNQKKDKIPDDTTVVSKTETTMTTITPDS